LNGKKHGQGKWKKKATKENGYKSNNYDGEYKNDQKNGYGVFHWESGNIYKGQYKDDERNGLGEMTWTDGSVYFGYWKNGI
jgi:hypothetical protein